MESLLVHIIYLIILSVIIALISFTLLKKQKIKDDSFLKILMIILGLIITFYIRFIVYFFTLPWPDENNYIKLILNVLAGKNPPVSGPGHLLLVKLFSSLTLLPIKYAAPTLAIFFSIFMLFFIYLIYRKKLPKIYATLSCIILLSTSYFIYPMLEGRPQQLGMLLVFACLIFLYDYLKNKNTENLFFFSLFYLLVFYYHILSFFIATFCVFIFWYWQYVEKKSEFKQLLPLIILFLISAFLYFCLGKQIGYAPNKGAILFSTKGLINFFIPFQISNALFLYTTSILIFLMLTLLFLYADYNKKIKQKFNKFYFIWIIIIISAIVLFTQFTIKSSIYAPFYRHSLLLFSLFQMGNIFFGLMFIFGIFISIKDKKTDSPFFKYSIIMLALGFLLLIPSVFLGQGFNNWLIRVLNYWTIFAAPIALIPILKLKKDKLTISIILAILVVLSLINASRNPFIFNYPY